jgi:hypothetical protein
VNAGAPGSRVRSDRWTAVTEDGKYSAHFRAYGGGNVQRAMGADQAVTPAVEATVIELLPSAATG